jgi:hypothetical protein
MRRSTTSVATDRPLLGLLLLVELIAAVALIAWPDAVPSAPPVAAPVAVSTPAASTMSATLPDGRTATVLALNGTKAAGLASRIRTELGSAAVAVTDFWGDDWARRVDIVIAATDEEFLTLSGGGAPDTAAMTTSDRIVFAPGAAAMSDGALRIVLRHELFHYASRAETAADAPRWLTEGVADYVGRPSAPPPGPALAASLAVLPADADLGSPGPSRSLSYDRAWWFSRFVADRYGPAALRRLYLAACAPGHVDIDTAVRETLGADTTSVLAAWRRWLNG